VVKADTYRPIYGAHRYFARRPHNVFAALIAGATPPGGLVLDPFAGGGVVALEAHLNGRRAYTKDYNPLASFIATEQLARWPLPEIHRQLALMMEALRTIELQGYGISCEQCDKMARVVWAEHSATASCENCFARATVNELEKVGPARYRCASCKIHFSFVPVQSTLHDITTVFIECDKCGHDYEDSSARTCAFEAFRSAQSVPERLTELLPTSPIPDNNMQRESALHRKGFWSYADFFTNRSLSMNAELLSLIDRIEDDEVRRPILFIFSASLRYTNRMVTRNVAWRKKEALEWSKPGFWTPAIFLETNVLREFRRRAKSVLKSKRLLQSTTALPFRSDIIDGSSRSSITCGSSAQLELPTDSVDAVVTDPPYGSYVHYADLSNFWLAWLKTRVGVPTGVAPTAEEAVVARKPGFPGAKTFEDYSDILRKVFDECARVLKNNGPLVLTFNNREARAWDAIFTALAGAFCIAGIAVDYQPGIERYEHTAQLRRGGSLKGDFVLRLHTRRSCENTCESKHGEVQLTEATLRERVRMLLNDEPLTTNDLYRRLYTDVIPILAAGKATSSELAAVDRLLESARGGLKNHFAFDGKYWSIAAS
jgi:putative DNA methylase